jgi:tRNA (guanine37-N1)-methyltransferase
MFEAPLAEGVVGRAIQRGVLKVGVHDLRDFTTDRHRSVDDVPYGGGPGMVLKPEPLFRAVDAIREAHGDPGAIVLTSPQGRRFTQTEAERLRDAAHVVVLCGRYEGVDDRVRQHLVTEELSIGDYVVSGGELPALVVIDAVARLVPGVVGDSESLAAESFSRGLLDCPQYTRPAEYRGWEVPDVLVSGHHGRIAEWRKSEAVRRTWLERPDLLNDAALDDQESAALRALLRREVRKQLGEGADDESD